MWGKRSILMLLPTYGATWESVGLDNNEKEVVGERKRTTR
jgi:hypothetical protein